MLILCLRTALTEMGTTMELNEAHAVFRPAETPSTQAPIHPSEGIHISLLTDNLDLRWKMEKLLASANCKLVASSSLASVEKAVDDKLCDVALIDIYSQDDWPESVFSRFDDKACAFPIVVICRSKQEASIYRQKAEYVSDIFPYDAVNDPRFFSVIEAAKFRDEFIEDDRQSDSEIWLPAAS